VTKPFVTIVTAVGSSIAIALVWWTWSLTADPLVRKSAVDAYQLKAEAEARFELLAAENETDRLATQLELIKLKIERFVEISRVRPLTDSEQIELRSAESERNVILQRLAAKG
jgi:hypothetical protein